MEWMEWVKWTQAHPPPSHSRLPTSSLPCERNCLNCRQARPKPTKIQANRSGSFRVGGICRTPPESAECGQFPAPCARRRLGRDRPGRVCGVGETATRPFLTFHRVPTGLHIPGTAKDLSHRSYPARFKFVGSSAGGQR